jgi:hypothetical protein
MALKPLLSLHRRIAIRGKKGTICRFGYDGDGKELVPQTKMDINTGKVYLKRGNAFANNHNPMVSAVGRCNQDIQTTWIGEPYIDVFII